MNKSFRYMTEKGSTWINFIFSVLPILINQNIFINKIQQDARVCRYLFTASLLYMFQAYIAPIIRSTKKKPNCRLWYRSYYVTVQRPSSNLV